MKKISSLYISAMQVGALFLILGLAQSGLTQPTINPLRTLQVATDHPQNLQAKSCLPGQVSNNNLNHNGLSQSSAKRPKRSPTLLIWQDLRWPQANRKALTLIKQRRSASSRDRNRVWGTARPVVVEAQGWTRDQKGRILLTAIQANRKHDAKTPVPMTC